MCPTYMTLTRLDIGRFHIADFDTFELPNFNRQAGATVSHFNKSKVDVLAEMALDIMGKEPCFILSLLLLMLWSPN